ncbi:hypothetical protein PoB_002598500 [Plakobranchus ocellatus]|uniref:Uncharacterized protein n=1 Tax=Plakobranchus ocellatus TaxID=259542 RepID=A0AAV3ZWC4_9GAST|nr:hypothetical protein PoB_002598500 [Plakobranchus ocellatus]
MAPEEGRTDDLITRKTSQALVLELNLSETLSHFLLQILQPWIIVIQCAPLFFLFRFCFNISAPLPLFLSPSIETVASLNLVSLL